MDIKNHADLAAHLGAVHNTEESISHRVYKSTTCGAWAKLEEKIPTGRNEEWTWLYDIRQAILLNPCPTEENPRRTNLACVLRKVRRIQDRTWTAPKDAPKEVLDALFGHEFRGRRCILTHEETIQFVKDNPPKHPSKYFRCKAKTYIGGYSPGVSFGSIVEGVEMTTDVRTIAYPCTGEEIDAAIKEVEAQARDIWNETHGCPQCYDGKETVNIYEWVSESGDDLGARVVDPKCPQCHGQGVVI